jgi:hypothetical protein
MCVLSVATRLRPVVWRLPRGRRAASAFPIVIGIPTQKGLYDRHARLECRPTRTAAS